MNFKLTDHKGTPISVDSFVGIVKTFHKSDFTLVVEYESKLISPNSKIVTPMVIMSYETKQTVQIMSYEISLIGIILSRCLKIIFGRKTWNNI